MASSAPSNPSTRIPLPPLQTQDLSAFAATAEVSGTENLKITPHSVTTQHVFVDCRGSFVAGDAAVCEDEDAEGCGGDSPGASSDRSLRSSRASFSSATTTATTAAAAHVSTSRVKVVVRVRPVDASVKTCVSTHKVSDGATSAAQVQLHDPSRDVQPFAVNVDAALPPIVSPSIYHP